MASSVDEGFQILQMLTDLRVGRLEKLVHWTVVHSDLSKRRYLGGPWNRIWMSPIYSLPAVRNVT